MYSETCINWSCSKAETLVRRTDMFDPVCFLYTSLSKVKTAKWALPQTENFFQSSHKKSACLTRTQLKILGISKKQIIKLDIFFNFLKIKFFFYTLKRQYLFAFILQFWMSAILLSRTLNLFFQVSLCIQPTVVLRHWKRYRTGAFKPYPTPL